MQWPSDIDKRLRHRVVETLTRLRCLISHSFTCRLGTHPTLTRIHLLPHVPLMNWRRSVVEESAESEIITRARSQMKREKGSEYSTRKCDYSTATVRRLCLDIVAAAETIFDNGRLWE